MHAKIQGKQTGQRRHPECKLHGQICDTVITGTEGVKRVSASMQNSGTPMNG